MSAPPQRLRRLLARSLPRRDRESLLDEMDRLYARKVQTDGAKRAQRWYRSEVWQFAARWPAEQLGEIGRRGLAGIDRRGLGGILKRGLGEFGHGRELFRQTVRGLRRVPGFAAVAITTLGLGIGAASVIVAIADRALMRPLPYPEPERLVAVLDGWGASLGALEILQREMTTVETVGGARNAVGMTLETGDGPARRVTVASVSPEYMEALGVSPVVGRMFNREEAQPDRGQVVLLGHTFWQSHFGGTADALGRSLTLDGESYLVVGVLPRGFGLPTGRNELWRPATMDASNSGLHWGAGNHTIVARMAPGASPETVRSELLRVQEDVRAANPLWTPNPGFWDEARVTPLRDAKAAWVRTPLLVLLGAVGVLLLVVCANVASLFVSRSLARSRDRAVRSALGAGGGHLAREQVVEILIVSVAGLSVGLVLSHIGLAALRPFLPAELPGLDEVGLDVRIVAITSTIALLVAIAAGVLPAMGVARTAPARFLREAGRGSSASPARRRTTRWLVAAQLSAAVVLVTSSGLLARTLIELGRVDTGFQPEGRVTAQLHLPPGLSTDPAARALYFETLRAQLEADPALERVALASTIPFGAEEGFTATAIDGVTTDPNDLPVMPHHRVSAEFFETAAIPLTRGRAFDQGDQVGTPMVAIVDETFVSRFFPDGRPIGRVIRYPWRGAPPIEIVGVVGATRHGNLEDDLLPTVWVPLAQMGLGAFGHAVAVARVAGSLDGGLAAITRRTRELDDRITVSDMATYPQLLADSLAGTRLMTILLLVFAGTTLALGCLGVYGVTAFFVRARVREIGVRMALGAPIARIRRRVLTEGLRLAVPGGILGVLLSIPAARALRGVLFGVAPLDPLTFSVAPLILAFAALVAAYLPARQATRVDPITVLREE